MIFNVIKEREIEFDSDELTEQEVHGSRSRSLSLSFSICRSRSRRAGRERRSDANKDLYKQIYKRSKHLVKRSVTSSGQVLMQSGLVLQR